MTVPPALISPFQCLFCVLRGIPAYAAVRIMLTILEKRCFYLILQRN
jgi:hypothetical protein